jgi:hypothetical protein
MIAAALLLPLIVLAGEGCPLLFVEDNDIFFSTTFRTTSGFFGGEGATEAVDAVDFTDARDGERFAAAGLNLPDSATDDGRFVLVVVELIEAVDGTLGLEIVTFPVV